MGIGLPVLCLCKSYRYWIASVVCLYCQCCVFVRVTGIGLPVLCVCKSYGYWIASVVCL